MEKEGNATMGLQFDPKKNAYVLQVEAPDEEELAPKSVQNAKETIGKLGQKKVANLTGDEIQELADAQNKVGEWKETAATQKAIKALQVMEKEIQKELKRRGMDNKGGTGPNVGVDADEVVAILKKAGAPMTSGELRNQLDPAPSAASLRAVLENLIEEKTVRAEGVRRGKRYSLNKAAK
jgi:hypothetical protein